MRRKRWLTVAMVVTAAVAVMMAATSYKRNREETGDAG